MKNSLKAFLGSAALLVSLTQNSSALTQYVNGVTTSNGVNLTGLSSDGWTSLVDISYGDALGTDNIGLQALAAATGSLYVFVGAADLQGNIVVGATGLISEVLSQTFSTSQASFYSSSNLGWYNFDGYSFGFTPTTNIYLTSADVTGSGIGGSLDDGQNALRLSWHDQSGGWRAGANIDLNSSREFRKIVLVGGGEARVPDATSSLVLAVMGFVAVMGARRLRCA